jgi:hypothetical protein
MYVQYGLLGTIRRCFVLQSRRLGLTVKSVTLTNRHSFCTSRAKEMPGFTKLVGSPGRDGTPMTLKSNSFRKTDLYLPFAGNNRDG